MRYTGPELAEKAGIDLDLAARLWTAMGFPQPDESEAAYTDEDVAALKYAGELISSHVIARPHPDLLAGFGA